MFLGAVCLLVILAGMYKYDKISDETILNNEPLVASTTPSTSKTFSKDDLISVKIADEPITSPYTITGIARGQWYFEASFPLELVDANGVQIARTIGTAEGDWMTTEFVPFTATFLFSTSTTKTGKIILRKDNPSGESSRDNSLTIPIIFKVFEKETLEGFEMVPLN